MKAIALTQPWATLVVTGAKWIETRSWRTLYRGDLAILASKKYPREAEALGWDEPFRSALVLSGYDSPATLPTGQLVGLVTLTHCRPIHFKRNQPPEPERSFGDYTPGVGRWAWHLTNPRRFKDPIPFKGRLGLFHVPSELVSGAEYVPPVGWGWL